MCTCITCKYYFVHARTNLPQVQRDICFNINIIISYTHSMPENITHGLCNISLWREFGCQQAVFSVFLYYCFKTLFDYDYVHNR